MQKQEYRKRMLANLQACYNYLRFVEVDDFTDFIILRFLEIENVGNTVSPLPGAKEMFDACDDLAPIALRIAFGISTGAPNRFDFAKSWLEIVADKIPAKATAETGVVDTALVELVEAQKNEIEALKKEVKSLKSNKYKGKNIHSDKSGNIIIVKDGILYERLNEYRKLIGESDWEGFFETIQENSTLFTDGEYTKRELENSELIEQKNTCVERCKALDQRVEILLKEKQAFSTYAKKMEAKASNISSMLEDKEKECNQLREKIKLLKKGNDNQI